MIIKGRWIRKENKVEGDESCRLIKHLITDHFKKVTERESGWAILYQNPLDGSYWELTYPQGELQGGGPPQLEKLSIEEVSKRYNAVPGTESAGA